jgi:hypothetical protein
MELGGARYRIFTIDLFLESQQQGHKAKDHGGTNDDTCIGGAQPVASAGDSQEGVG